MSLLVWLPMTKDLSDQGLGGYTITNDGATLDNNGKLGKCYNFDGTNDRILVSGLNNPKNITIAFWMKRNATTNTRQFLFTAWNGVSIELSAANNLFGKVQTSSGEAGGASGGTITADSGWVHVCYTFEDKVGGKMYINGVLTSSGNTTSSIAWNVTSGYIGNYSNIYLNAKLNDFRIYDHVLSPKEIEVLSRGLVCHYPLNGGGRTNNNMISGTHRSDFSTTSTSVSDGKLCVGSGGNGTFSITTDTTCPVGKYSYNVLNNTAGNRDFQQANVPYVTGKKYTGSWWAKGSGACLYRVWNGTKGTQEMGVTFTLTSEWKHYSYTFTANQNMGTDNCTFHLGVTGASSINICGMKLEEGEQATPWIPNPIDDAYIAMGYDSTTEYDVSGYGYNGTKNGTMTYSSDTARYSVSTKFADTTYIETSSPCSNVRSASFWIKTDKTTYRVAWADAKSKLAFGIVTAGDILISCNGGYTKKYPNSVITANVWQHIVIVRGEDIANTDLYVNGVKQTPGTSQDYWTHTSDSLIINGRGYSTPSRMNSQMSDFRLYATALSADDIKELYDTVASVTNNGTLLTRGEFIET